MFNQGILWSTTTDSSLRISGSDNDEDDVDDEQHSKLLKAIGSLDGKKGKRVQQRSEAVKEISEFTLASKDGKSSHVRVHELMGTLKSTTSHSELKKQLINVQRKSKTLSASLPKHEALKPATPLEEEIYTLLHGSKHMERPDKEFTQAEEEALKAMSLEEAKARRAELQKARALQSYYESKCKRQKKIKSKK